MIKYKYLDDHLKWMVVSADKPIARCMDCGRYRMIVGVGTVCNLLNRNIGEHHYFRKKPVDCPLKEQGAAAMNETTVTVTANEWIRLNQLEEKLRQIKLIAERTWQNDNYRFGQILKSIVGRRVMVEQLKHYARNRRQLGGR